MPKAATLFSGMFFCLTLILAFPSFSQCLIANFPFNDNAHDTTGSGNNGAIFGPLPASDRYQTPNAAYSFDGVDDYISFNNINFGNFGTVPYSISFWLQTNYNGFQQFVIGKRDGCTSNNFWQITVRNGTIMLNDAMPNQKIIGTIAVNDGQWHHIAAIRDNGSLKVYVDAQIDAAQGGFLVNDPDNTMNLVIGTSACVGIDGTVAFSGILDDIKIFDCALNETEIAKLADKPLPCTVTVYDTITVIDTNVVTIFDTTTVSILYDTISVADTLLIDVVLSVNPLRESTIKVYPNPTNNLLIIDNSNYTQMANFTMKIVNGLGQELFNSPCNVPTITVDLRQFNSTGLYFLQVINPANQIIEEKKIVLY